MSLFIIHKDGVFNFYSTIVDAPYFKHGLTEEEVREYIKEEYGSRGLRDLPQRLARAKKKGTSSLMSSSLKRCIEINRAGENESNLSFSDFCNRFLVKPKELEAGI